MPAQTGRVEVPELKRRLAPMMCLEVEAQMPSEEKVLEAIQRLNGALEVEESRFLSQPLGSCLVESIRKWRSEVREARGDGYEVDFEGILRHFKAVYGYSEGLSATGSSIRLP